MSSRLTIHDDSRAKPLVRAVAGEPHHYAFLVGGGEMSRLIDSHDWSATSLGSLANWPSCLKTTVGIMLRSNVAMVVLWGQDGVMIYNDAYAVFAGLRHPQLLGTNVREGWPEVAAFNDNVMNVCLAGNTLKYRDPRIGAPSDRRT
jgi:hypothetical protein